MIDQAIREGDFRARGLNSLPGEDSIGGKALADDPVLKSLVELIVEAVQPEQVILFGSRAKGNGRPDSDYDFLIVKNGIEHEREVSAALYRTFYLRGVKAPSDLIVVDSEKFEALKDVVGYIYRVAAREGVVVYG